MCFYSGKNLTKQNPPQKLTTKCKQRKFKKENARRSHAGNTRTTETCEVRAESSSFQLHFRKEITPKLRRKKAKIPLESMRVCEFLVENGHEKFEYFNFEHCCAAILNVEKSPTVTAVHWHMAGRPPRDFEFQIGLHHKEITHGNFMFVSGFLSNVSFKTQI